MIDNIFLSFAVVYTWIKLQIRLVVASKILIVHDYPVKKCKNILKEYMYDKRTNKVSESDRVHDCKWFQKMVE